MVIDYEIYPYAEKSRRLFIELLELFVVSLLTFLLFISATSNIITHSSSYKNNETLRVEARNDLFHLGQESHLVRMYNENHALDTYDMFIRYSYKCIHRSFELYEEDFQKEGFKKITDPYQEPSISKDNDELLYFYTVYAIDKGLIVTDNPLDYYRNEILDLDKHKNIIVYNDTFECFILNNQAPSNGSTINIAVALDKELYDDNKSFAMNTMYKFYKEYYDKANRLFEKTDAYKEAYSRYEHYSLETSKPISFGILITYFIVALPYFLIMPLIRKAGNTPLRLFTHVELTDKDGNYLKWYKKLIYYLIKVFVSFCCIFVSFYFGYGNSIFLAPFGKAGGFVLMPIHFIAITAIIWIILGLLSLLPVFNEFKTTPFEYLLNIRTADRRMDFEDKKDYRGKKKTRR